MKMPGIILPSIFLLLPRSPVTYPLYALSGPLLVDLRKSPVSAYVIFFALVAWFFLSFIVVSAQRELSSTAFVLELVLLSPLLLFISGFSFAFKARDCLLSIRLINLGCFVFSLVNLIGHGFPLALPYLHYLPDEYFGPYGTGGARIVTIAGFTGLLLETCAQPPSRHRWLWLMIALSNFIVPSYILGIVCGLAAFGLLAVRRPGLLVLTCLLIIPAGIYALERLANVNSIIAQTIGWHPKVYAHLLVFKVFATDTLALFFGTGIGQFTSTPQTWASEPFQYISAQSAPNLPGLEPSFFHEYYIYPVSSLAYENKWALSSALNKPYTGITTLFVELGAFSVVVVYLFFKRAAAIWAQNRMALVFFAFFIALNAVDQWLDNLWLGYCLLLSAACFSDRDRPC